MSVHFLYLLVLLFLDQYVYLLFNSPVFFVTANTVCLIRSIDKMKESVSALTNCIESIEKSHIPMSPGNKSSVKCPKEISVSCD